MYTEKLSQLIAEDAGNLSGMPKHAIKIAVKRGGGRKSPVEVSTGTSHHGFTKALNNALKTSKSVAVHANGKHVATVHTNDDYTQKQKYGLTRADGSMMSTKVTHRPMRSHYRDDHSYMSALKRHHESPRTSQNTHYSKRDIIDHAVHHLGRHTGGEFDPKKHSYTIHAVGHDKDRAEKKADRAANLKDRISSKHNYSSDKHYHPSGDKGLAKNLDKAASKMATKMSGNSGTAKAALDHHAKIGELIKAGKHAEARKHISTLDDHLWKAGRDKADHHSVKSNIKDLKKPQGDWSRKSSLDRLRRLSEHAEMIEELSRGTLQRYVEKAGKSLDKLYDKMDHHADKEEYHNRKFERNFGRKGKEAVVSKAATKADKHQLKKEKLDDKINRREEGVYRATSKINGD